MKIPDKAAFKRLSEAGLLGNYFQQWDCADALCASGYTGWVTIRSRRPDSSAATGHFVPFIKAKDAPGKIRQLVKRYGAKIEDLYVNEIPGPDSGRIINLEAARTPTKGHHDPVGRQLAGLYVRYSPASNVNLRHDLAQNGRDVEGLVAHHVLHQYLQEDAQTLWDIWDLCPDAVIEASRFTVPVGVFRSQLIIWEVRNF